MGDVLDIKKRLAEKVKARLASSDDEMKEKYERLQALVANADSVDEVMGLVEEVALLSSTILAGVVNSIGDTNASDAESLSRFYFGTILGAGKLLAITEAMKLLMDRLAELEPDILDEHFLSILDELKD